MRYVLLYVAAAGLSLAVEEVGRVRSRRAPLNHHNRRPTMNKEIDHQRNRKISTSRHSVRQQRPKHKVEQPADTGKNASQIATACSSSVVRRWPGRAEPASMPLTRCSVGWANRSPPRASHAACEAECSQRAGSARRRSENDLEFVIVGRRSEHAGTQITGEVSGQLFAFAQPGNQVLIAPIGDAARHHQRDRVRYIARSPGRVW